MNSTRLNELWNALHEKETSLIGIKAGEYANDDERLYNFKNGAALIGGLPSQVAWAYLTKHLIAIQKAVMNGSFQKINFDWAIKHEDGGYTEGLIQKIVDARNYLFFILACLEEEESKQASFTTETAP